MVLYRHGVDGGKWCYIGKRQMEANRAMWASGGYGQIELYRQAVDMCESSYMGKSSLIGRR